METLVLRHNKNEVTDCRPETGTRLTFRRTEGPKPGRLVLSLGLRLFVVVLFYSTKFVYNVKIAIVIDGHQCFWYQQNEDLLRTSKF